MSFLKLFDGNMYVYPMLLLLYYVIVNNLKLVVDFNQFIDISYFVNFSISLRFFSIQAPN